MDTIALNSSDQQEMRSIGVRIVGGKLYVLLTKWHAWVKVYCYRPYHLFLGAFSQNCEKQLSALSCLSVRLHGTARLPLEGF